MPSITNVLGDAMTVLLYIQFYDAFNNGWVHCHHAERLG